MLLTLDLLMTSAALTVETAFPIARRLVSPAVPVMTISSSEMALGVIAIRRFAVAPDASENVVVIG
jgi:hypothetical protein